MSRYALLVGITHYSSASHDEGVYGATNDAQSWAAVLHQRGFTCTLLLDSDASRANVLCHIRNLLGSAQTNDSVVITFAGHGSRLPDDGGDEQDAYDECWCPHDLNPITDDEIRLLLRTRPLGVPCVVISDSCHSGTVTRARRAPVRYLDHRHLHPLPRHTRQPVDPTPMDPLLVSACQDDQGAEELFAEDAWHGAFTYCARQALMAADGCTYREWHQLICRSLIRRGYNQTPNLFGPESLKNSIVL